MIPNTRILEMIKRGLINDMACHIREPEKNYVSALLIFFDSFDRDIEKINSIQESYLPKVLKTLLEIDEDLSKAPEEIKKKENFNYLKLDKEMIDVFSLKVVG